jgi:hypothetical protein
MVLGPLVPPSMINQPTLLRRKDRYDGVHSYVAIHRRLLRGLPNVIATVMDTIHFGQRICPKKQHATDTEILRQLGQGTTFAYRLCLINLMVFSPVSEM